MPCVCQSHFPAGTGSPPESPSGHFRGMSCPCLERAFTRASTRSRIEGMGVGCFFVVVVVVVGARGLHYSRGTAGAKTVTRA